jgi:asparaginyl-tRNA synthetase
MNTELTRIAELLTNEPLHQTVTVGGWLKTKRDSKDFSFLDINDGSCLANLQVIASQELNNYKDTVIKLTTGCSLQIKGQV